MAEKRKILLKDEKGNIIFPMTEDDVKAGMIPAHEIIIGSDGSGNAILFTPQTLNDEQKVQVRVNMGIQEWERLLNQLICGMDRFGHAKGLSVDVDEDYKICGRPMRLEGHGTPSAKTIPEQNGIPISPLQFYIDLDVPNFYYAKGTSSVSDWIKL